METVEAIFSVAGLLIYLVTNVTRKINIRVLQGVK